MVGAEPVEAVGRQLQVDGVYIFVTDGIERAMTQAKEAAGDEGVSDAERLARHAQAHGVDVRLEVYPVAAHRFQLCWSFLPEVPTPLQRVGEYTRHRTTGR